MRRARGSGEMVRDDGISHPIFQTFLSFPKIQNAKHLYLTTVNVTFSLDHCWDILKDAKKWQDFCAMKQPSRTPKGLRTLTDETDVAMGEEGRGRPIGRKAAKEENKRKRERLEEVLQKVVEHGDLVVKEICRKNETLDRAVDESIMSKDTSGMDKDQKEFYSLQRKMVMAKWRRIAQEDRHP